MRTFTERQALRALAEEMNDTDESEDVKEYLSHTLRTGQRYGVYVGCASEQIIIE